MKKTSVHPITLLFQTIQSLKEGLRLTFKHLFQAGNRRAPVGVMSDAYFKQPEGIVTTEYPHESIPLPDHGRYQLHNEISDCIVCDLCAKICPVNCIEIDPIKSPVEIGKTSDGSTKRIYAATFNIDMAKCMYCGLCTTVCPTECLTMTKEYDFSVYDVRELVFPFAELSPEEAAIKRKEVAELQEIEKAKKAAAAAAKASASTSDTEAPSAVTKPSVSKPVMGKPVIGKPVPPSTTDVVPPASESAASPDTPPSTPSIPAVNKPVMGKPIIKPSIPKPPTQTDTEGGSNV